MNNYRTVILFYFSVSDSLHSKQLQYSKYTDTCDLALFQFDFYINSFAEMLINNI